MIVVVYDDDANTRLCQPFKLAIIAECVSMSEAIAWGRQE